MFFRLIIDSIDQVDLPCRVQQHFDFDAKKFAGLLTFTMRAVHVPRHYCNAFNISLHQELTQPGSGGQVV
jgi:hypothetical protein